MSKVILPSKLVEFLTDEIAKAAKVGSPGEPRHTAGTHGRIIQAVEPHAGKLAIALARGAGEMSPDGRVILRVARHPGFRDNLLKEGQTTVRVAHDPRTGEWISDTAASIRCDFLELAAHVWRVQGLDLADNAFHEGTAQRVLAFIGAACLRYLEKDSGL